LLPVPDDSRSGFPEGGIANQYWRGIVLLVKQMLFLLARPKAKSFLFRTGHTRTNVSQRDIDSAGDCFTIFAGPKCGQKPIVQFIAFATEIFPCTKEQPEATEVMVRASPPLQTFKISFR
jgi:hypothetical protein